MNRSRAYWSLQIGGWLLYALINTVYFSGHTSSLGATLVGNLLVSAAGLGFTQMWRSQRLRAQQISGWHVSGRVILELVTGVLLCAGALGGVTYGLLAGFAVWSGLPGPSPASWLYSSLNYTFLFGLWITLYVAWTFWAGRREAEQARVRAETERDRAELSWLRSQLEPHFLFNALNTVNALIDENPEQAREAVRTLSRFLRRMLESTPLATTTVEEELAFCTDYLNLQKLRWTDRLRVDVTVDPSLLPYAIPAFAVQTLVENAIKHQTTSAADPTLHLVIRGKLTDGRVQLAVVNPGQLNVTPRESAGIGLKNLRDRLRVLYGSTASLMLVSAPAGHVTAQLDFPIAHEGPIGR